MKSRRTRATIDGGTTMPRTSIHRVEADGVSILYREAGSPDAPVVLLLHGFPGFVVPVPGVDAA
jgi:hypothetical protein